MAKLAPISDYVWFQEGPGVRNTQYTTSGVKLLNVANLVDGRVDLSTSDRYISTEEAYGRYKHFLVDPDDFIIASSGIQIDYFDQKMGFVSEDQLPLCMNTSTIRFKPIDEGELDMRYFMYYLKSNSFKQQLSKYIVGSAQLNFGPTHLKKMTFPVVDVEQQHYISMVLYKADELISLRKKQLQKLDDLVKSRFVEMFGEQGDNPYGFIVGTLNDVAEIYLGLTHTPMYIDEGKPFLSVRDISSGKIDFSNCHYISETEFDSLPKGARPKEADILFCRVGTIGKPVIIPKGTPEFGTFVSVGFLRRKERVINEYLKAWMEDPFFMKQVNDNVAGASQINLNTGWLKNFRILIPPLELQRSFANNVMQIEKTKLTVQQGLDKLELLKQSLMQKYFG